MRVLDDVVIQVRCKHQYFEIIVWVCSKSNAEVEMLFEVLVIDLRIDCIELLLIGLFNIFECIFSMLFESSIMNLLSIFLNEPISDYIPLALFIHN